MKVTLHYDKKYKVPADAKAIILNPTLVASRTIQLEPPYRGGPVLANKAVIPEERTEVPVEWDTLRNDVTNIINKLGPTAESPKAPSVTPSRRSPTGWRQGPRDQHRLRQPVGCVDGAEQGPR